MSYRADKLVIDGHTDTHTQATTIPEGQNCPRVKKIIIVKSLCDHEMSFKFNMHNVYQNMVVIYK